MSLLKRLSFWGKRKNPSNVIRESVSQSFRNCRFETMEERQVLSADPLFVGGVYIEDDSGTDSTADSFYVSFEGGSETTEMTRIVIDGNQDGNAAAMGEPDVYFDITPNDAAGNVAGFGGAHPFQFDSESVGLTAADILSVQVADGGTRIVIDLKNFEAGDVLVFGIDVDQFFANKLDDQITSGIEFAGSSFQAFFNDPHYNFTPDTTTATGIFNYNFSFGADAQNDTGRLSGLPTQENLQPENDYTSQENRTAGVMMQYDLVPKPVTICGTVYHDRNMDLSQDAGEEGISGTTLRLQQLNDDGTYANVIRDGSAVTTTTDDNGDYCFGEELNLQPGTFRIIEVQPADFPFSVGAIPGTVEGDPTGQADGTNIIAEVEIPLGDMHSVDNDFGEVKGAKISGYVYHDVNFNGVKDAGEAGIANTELQLTGTDVFGNEYDVTGFTDANGFYCFENLAPGTYQVCEIQPDGYSDHFESIGTVRGATVGNTDNTLSQDKIRNITVGSEDVGIDYNFGEVTFATLSGHVQIETPDGNCVSADSPEYRGIAGVTVRLIGPNGIVQTTTTDANGFYEFSKLATGDYTVVEVTPSGYLDGEEHAGTINGQTVGLVTQNDRIEHISLASGQQAINYDFCEIEPASISGHVKVTTPDGRCVLADDPEYVGIAGVLVRLIDQNGNQFQTTTDANGYYEFVDLAPGTYTIVEQTPAGYLDGDEDVGQINGVSVGAVAGNDRLGNIVLGGSQAGVNYDFCEIRPASISGHVKVTTPDGRCVSADDPEYVGIEGVLVRLVDQQGIQLETTTDANGYYEFTDLAPGSYTIIEQTPAGYLDGDEDVGQINGVNVGLVAGNDRLGNIFLGGGQAGINYDFCEIKPASISGHVKVTTPDGRCVSADDPEYVGIEGVLVRLVDQQGIQLETTTDANGYYEFTDLAPGSYTIIEQTPVGYLDGDEDVGQINEVNVGLVAGNDRLGNIVLGGGQAGINYDFCEIPPASICGVVYHDRNNNGEQDSGEEGIAGVILQLLDGNGNLTGQLVLTGADGSYCFTDLLPGEYCVQEFQPATYYDGQDTAGTIGGTTVGTADSVADKICDITLLAGQNGIEYNFGELRPGAIEGYVHTDLDGNCQFDATAGEIPLADVKMQLLNADGDVIKSTFTDGDGFYHFGDLPPGVYSVRQIQPSGYFSDGQEVGVVAGSGNAGTGNAVANSITQITLTSGLTLTEYNFCEVPPAKLSGYVYQDGAVIELPNGTGNLSPAEVASLRNGQFTSDDQRIAGVTLELRDGITGRVINGDDANVLPGHYASGPIRTVTDANGYYCFDGLKAGNYAVFEVQPDGYIDNVDTPGTNDGVAINPTDDVSPFVLNALADGVDPRNDAILRISLASGDHSEFNNFSEVVVEQLPPDRSRPGQPPVTPPPTPPGIPQIGPRYVPTGLLGQAGMQPISRNSLVVAGQGALGLEETPAGSYVWQLSVIDDGFPRGDQIDSKEGITWRSAAFLSQSAWNSNAMTSGRWLYTTQDVAEISDSVRTEEFVFGKDGALPVVGDFNGDGIDEVGLFEAGQWFIDASGNRRWGQDDMWARLGTDADLPLVGDWNGDGKDDIGVYGKRMHFDEKDLLNEPGIPDSQNYGDSIPKNIPPNVSQRPDFKRDLQRSEKGDTRTDVVDHIFQYGGEEDYPVVGDWNGDGIRTIGIFRNGFWTLDVDGDGKSGTADRHVQFGQAGDIPVVGDFNGDGVEDIGVFRNGKWIIDVDGNYELDAHDKVFELGEAGDMPVVGDFDGDGVDEVGVYRGQLPVHAKTSLN